MESLVTFPVKSLLFLDSWNLFLKLEVGILFGFFFHSSSNLNLLKLLSSWTTHHGHGKHNIFLSSVAFLYFWVSVSSLLLFPHVTNNSSLCHLWERSYFLDLWLFPVLFLDSVQFVCISLEVRCPKLNAVLSWEKQKEITSYVLKTVCLYIQRKVFAFFTTACLTRHPLYPTDNFLKRNCLLDSCFSPCICAVGYSDLNSLILLA